MDELTVPFMTFNAKGMSLRQIAETFIPPSSFSQVAGGDHCYLVGPRGSGKTTLLRMLQGECLAAWPHAQAEIYREAVDYATIFLPTDGLWKAQTQTDGNPAFAIQLFYAFVDRINYRRKHRDLHGNPVHLPVLISDKQEREIVKFIGEVLEMREPLTFDELIRQLLFTLARIKDSDSLAPQWTFTQTITRLQASMKLLNESVGEPGRKWALLLDELELSPPEIHDEVGRFMRESAGGLVIKASVSPFGHRGHVDGFESLAAPGHDFQPIYLSEQSEIDRRSITKGLWSMALAGQEISDRPIEEVLGHSKIDPTRRWDDSVWGELQKAAAYDSEFVRWLERKGVSLDPTQSIAYLKKSESLRKAYPLIVFRNEILAPNSLGSRKGRRVIAAPFAGAESVEKCLEGNPRWIKSAFSLMLRGYSDSTGQVEPNLQYASLRSVADRFYSLLMLVPEWTDQIHPSPPVNELVDSIAGFMHAANTGPFTVDPINGFTVDSNCDAHLHQSVIAGLYAGAIVHQRSGTSPPILRDLEDEKFRLTYLLGVRKNLEYPLRRGKTVKLSRILASTHGVRQAVIPYED